MATTYSDVATNLITRLNVGSGGAEPTSANIQQFLRDATRELWGELPPIKSVNGTVSATYDVTLTNIDVFAVEYAGTQLVRGAEWSREPGKVIFKPGAVAVGETVTIYYQVDHGITDASTSVDSSCTFGTDWLQPLLMLRAEVEIHNRLANVGTTQSQDFHAAQYRVKQDDLEKMKASYAARVQLFLQGVQAAVQARLMAGDGVMREGALATMRNRARVSNSLFQ